MEFCRLCAGLLTKLCDESITFYAAPFVQCGAKDAASVPEMAAKLVFSAPLGLAAGLGVPQSQECLAAERTLSTACCRTNTQHCLLQNEHSALLAAERTLSTACCRTNTQHCLLQDLVFQTHTIGLLQDLVFHTHKNVGPHLTTAKKHSLKAWAHSKKQGWKAWLASKKHTNAFLSSPQVCLIVPLSSAWKGQKGGD